MSQESQHQHHHQKQKQTKQKTSYSPDSSTMRHDIETSDTIRYIRRKEDVEPPRPAPPPYIGQAIPRVKPIRTFQKGSNNSVGESSRPTSRRFDTFGENALETIYDQFKFLDESEDAPSAAQTPTSVNSTRPIMAMTGKKRTERRPGMIMYCVLPTLELLAAIAILATSFLSNHKDWEKRKEDVDVVASSDSTLASEAVRTLSIQNALSTVVPAFFQIVGALFGFWPIFPTSSRRSAQILHILFNAIVIVLWFNAIYDLFFKISMEHLLQNAPDEKYVVDLIVACFVYFATVVLPSITLSVAAFSLATSSGIRRIAKSLTAMSVSLGTLIFSLATTVIAVFTAQANLNGPKNLSDSSTMYAYGLKECIVFVFVVIVSIFSLIVSTQSNRPLMVGALIGQGICITAITSELFTSDRLSAIFNEFRSFETGSAIEIGIVLLNGCAVVSLLVLVLQLVVFVFCVSSVSPSGGGGGSAHSSLLIDNNRNPRGAGGGGGGHVERTAF